MRTCLDYARTPLPLIPPTPFSHKGRRGSLGVLMPETEDGTQGLARTSTPVSISPAPFSYKGRRGSLGVLMPFFPHRKIGGS
jgi:hypothetical protein